MEEIPEDLVLAIEIGIFGGLADVIKVFNLAVGLLYLEVLLSFLVSLVLFLLGLGIYLFRWHKYN